MIVLAIDLGGTIIKIGIVKDGKLLASETLTSNAGKGLSFSLKSIENIAHQLLAQLSISIKSVAGVGIGFPGLVDNKQMSVISTNDKYDDAFKIDLSGWANEAFSVPVFLENDARTALLGEWQYGSGKGTNNLVMLTLGTGVGSAAIIEGKLLVGKHFQAGCLGGHFTVNIQGEQCSCGNVGCVEAEASTWHLSKMLTSAPRYSESLVAGKEADFENIFNCSAFMFPKI